MEDNNYCEFKKDEFNVLIHLLQDQIKLYENDKEDPPLYILNLLDDLLFNAHLSNTGSTNNNNQHEEIITSNLSYDDLYHSLSITLFYLTKIFKYELNKKVEDATLHSYIQSNTLEYKKEKEDIINKINNISQNYEVIPLIQNMPKILWNDYDVALAAVKKNGQCYEYLASSLRENNDIIKTALLSTPLYTIYSFINLPDNEIKCLQDKEFVFELLKRHFDDFVLIDNDILLDKEFIYKLLDFFDGTIFADIYQIAGESIYDEELWDLYQSDTEFIINCIKKTPPEKLDNVLECIDYGILLDNDFVKELIKVDMINENHIKKLAEQHNKPEILEKFEEIQKEGI